MEEGEADPLAEHDVTNLWGPNRDVRVHARSHYDVTLLIIPGIRQHDSGAAASRSRPAEPRRPPPRKVKSADEAEDRKGRKCRIKTRTRFHERD